MSNVTPCGWGLTVREVVEAGFLGRDTPSLPRPLQRLEVEAPLSSTWLVPTPRTPRASSPSGPSVLPSSQVTERRRQSSGGRKVQGQGDDASNVFTLQPHTAEGQAWSLGASFFSDWLQGGPSLRVVQSEWLPGFWRGSGASLDPPIWQMGKLRLARDDMLAPSSEMVRWAEDGLGWVLKDPGSSPTSPYWIEPWEATVSWCSPVCLPPSGQTTSKRQIHGPLPPLKRRIKSFP
ncbi:uncharacterized protein LOC125611276 [Marmota marmota marmota]|uniref:uncharacterized protein LOC125611276 n=1 Tax=Marmota marmota marmota TaxID=9994 RepID=UPI0020923AE5|nr:uncharacterized protein LOC125611276 [Marmota marmota marmota]